MKIWSYSKALIDFNATRNLSPHFFVVLFCPGISNVTKGAGLGVNLFINFST